MSEKLLKGVFFILLLVLLGEIGYLFYTNSKINSSSQKNITTNQPSPIISYTPAFKNETLNSLSYLKKSIIISSILENTYQGEIIELDTQGGYLEKENFNFALKIRIKNKEDTNSFYFNKDELSKIKVYNQNKEEILINDIKVGDIVEIKHKLNLLEDLNNNLISFEIYLQ